MAEMTIQRRLALCMGVLGTVCAVQFISTSALNYAQYSSMKAQRLTAEVQNRQMLGDMKHDGIQGDVFRIEGAVRTSNAHFAESSAKDMASDIAELDSAYAFVYDHTYEGALQDAVEATKAPKQDYIAKARAVAERMRTNPGDYAAQMEAFTQSFDGFEKVQEQLSEAIRTKIAQENTTADRIVLISTILQVLTTIGVAVTLAAAAVIVRKHVVAPIRSLASALRRMAGGDYALAIPGTGRGDEVAEIAEAAQVFRDAAIAKQAADREQQQVVAELTTGLERLAGKDLEYKIGADFPPAYAMLKQNFNLAVASLADAISATRIGAVSVMNGVTEISSASDNLALRNEQQAQGVDLVNREASEGAAIVARAVAAMSALESSSEEITKITDVIDGISFQTNLLALNAGVEAARAGDSGKGFAVVANEVRALAQRSAEAASSIKVLIDKSSQEVDTAVLQVRETGGLLERIVTRIGDLNSTIQQNAAMAEETTAATRTVSQEAGRLSELVETFRTRNLASRPMHTPIASQLRRESVQEFSASPPPAKAPPPPVSAPAPAAAKQEFASDDGWAEF